MANHKSAIKKYRRDEKKRLINRVNRTKMRNRIKSLRKAVSSGNVEAAKELFPTVISIIDKTIIKGTIHKKTGSRYKARISLLMRKSGAAV
jgi:small subunit ribosomal protein S20